MRAVDRDARRWIRRRLVAAAKALAVDPGVAGAPDVRAARQAAALWAAVYLDPGDLPVAAALPPNLQALVTPSGTAPDGADPSTWRDTDDLPDPDAPRAESA